MFFPVVGIRETGSPYIIFKEMNIRGKEYEQVGTLRRLFPVKSCAALFLGCLLALPSGAEVPAGKTKKVSIYHKGWIDFNKNGRMDVFENPQAKLEDRVEDLLRQMTVEEKTCQMATLYGSGRVLKEALPVPEWKNEVWKDGIGNIDEEHNGLGKFRSQYSFPYRKHVEAKHEVQRWFVEETRLGIPVDFTNEGIRGLCHDRATYFPAQCGQGATWNKKLVSEIGRVTAEEAVALGYTNIYSPILDVARDPRWGRVVECYGEDPYLVGQLGREMVLSLQKAGLVSTPKHFAVYSVPVGGRDEGTRTDPHVAPREMRTLFLEPFRVAFQDAKAMGVMSSYNDWNGEPVSGSYFFLTQILRQEWGFDGYVVSDSEAVEFLHSKHRVAKDWVEAAAQVANAGLNIRTQFTPPEDFILPLREAVAQGKVSPEVLDQRVREILKVKFRLGLFDNPYLGDGEKAEKVVHSPEHQAVALEAARQSMVLLKNEGGLLPLKKDIKSVAVIGPNADERKNLICRYGPANAPLVTVYQGLKQYLPDAEVTYAKGCEIIDPHFPESELLEFPLDSAERAGIAAAVEAARKAEVAVVVLGGSERTVREGNSRTSLELPGRQEMLLKAVAETGTPVVLVLLDGRAAAINWADKHIPAILHGWFPGEFCGQVIAETLFGENNPGGRLAVTFPKSVGQIPYAFPFKPGADTKGPTRVSGALYPFGYGLSYTTFAYSDLQVSPEKGGIHSHVTVKCRVKNTGKLAGDEVVQLYVHDLYSSVTTYTKMLRGFERIRLQPGEEKEVEFVLNSQDLGLWDIHDQFVVEPGEFEVFVGASSQDIKLQGKFELK